MPLLPVLEEGIVLGLGVVGSPVRIGAAIAGCALVAACTSGQPPAVTPTPTATSSPTPSATPSETDIERQMRLDFEGGEQAYRASIAEQDRLSQRGVSRATPELKRTSAGKYLQFALSGLDEIEKSGWRTVGDLRIVGVARGGWQEGRIHLVACEDGSGILIIDKTGRDVTPKKAIATYVQNLTVQKYGNDWKVSDIRSKGVKTFEGSPCGS
jgi:hypothetical protein